MSEEKSNFVQGLQRSLVEMTVGFDATIEAFSRALEMHEGESLGHTYQVTTITVNLSQVIGLNPNEQLNIRRGALLHDIGKMAISDQILKKEDALTKEEWAIVRNHPQLAYDLLFPIAVLHPAIDIPYSHHERWDGNGYPQGLSGKQIPLAARIFSVVDVWDALISDRPYRKAWPEKDVLAYLTENAGKQFDPEMVNIFLTREFRKRVTRPLI